VILQRPSSERLSDYTENVLGKIILISCSGWDTMSFKHLLNFILKCGSSNCGGRNLLFTTVSFSK
jgi:hypothetical protein